MVKALDAPYEAGRRGGELAQGQARAHARPRRARRRVGARPPPGLAQQHPSRRPRRGRRRLRDARQDVQGHDRRDARLADGAAPRARDARATATRSTCGPSSSSRSRSTASSRARATRAASRSASRASRATGPTSPPRKRTRSRPCASWQRARRAARGCRSSPACAARVAPRLRRRPDRGPRSSTRRPPPA